MCTRLDPTKYRPVTEKLFPASALSDAALLEEAFGLNFDVGSVCPREFGDTTVFEHQPSGVLIERGGDAISRAWAPDTIEEKEVKAWGANIHRWLAPGECVQQSHPLLCHAPVRHRFDLPACGLSIFPAPDSAPRVRGAPGPAMLRFAVSTVGHPVLNAKLAARRFDWWALMLNALTHLRVNHSIRRDCAWAWDRTNEHSQWSELHYESPKVRDQSSIDLIFKQAPPGAWLDDAEYFLSAVAATEIGATLPRSLDETLSAADQLVPPHRTALMRYAMYLRTADHALRASLAISFLSTMTALEALAHDWAPSERPTIRFRQLFSGLLPSRPHFAAAADRLYKLRCGVVHEGLVFPDDWIGGIPDDYAQTPFSVRLAAQLIGSNWIRSRRNRPLLLRQPETGPSHYVPA